MIWLVWVLWYSITIVNVVILLNFLIAYIGSTYERVYGRMEVDSFTNMATMNHELREVAKQLKLVKETLIKWVPYLSKFLVKPLLIPILPFSYIPGCGGIKDYFLKWPEWNY
jgi:hypothetical protein